MSAEYEAVEGVPSGLIACRLGGEEAHIARISPRALWLRLDENQVPGADIELYFYHPDRGEYSRLRVQSDRAEPAPSDDFGATFRLSIDDPAYAKAVRRALADYARYVEWRLSGGLSLCARELTGYPAEGDEDFHPSVEAQYAAWFGDAAPVVEDAGDYELALVLGDPSLWDAFLHRGGAPIWEVYARNRGIPRAILPGRPPNRLYLGSASCPQLFPGPGRLTALFDAADRENLPVTLVTSRLRPGGGAAVDALMDMLARRDRSTELVVNDWGMLERLQRRRGSVEPVLGPLLNKLRRDPRMPWKAGYAARGELLERGNLSDPALRAFLQNLGVKRLEYEACGHPIQVPEGRHSLHLPFYHTNVSAWCPLKAICERGARGAQGPTDNCPGWCARNALLYPKHLNMIGRGSALLALDMDAGARIPEHIDRLVFNF